MKEEEEEEEVELGGREHSSKDILASRLLCSFSK